MPSNYLPQVDYTSRDYSAIRDDMVSLISQFLPEWTTTDASDFGITLIELFAYMGDILNYYIDRAANEGFITTATQRSSVLSIANLLNYKPSNGNPAKALLTFQNANSTAKTIPALTQVATTTIVNGVSTQIIFETDSEVVIPAAVGAVKGSVNVLATQGTTISDEYLGDSTGASYEVFTIGRHPVIQKTTSVTANGVAYREVDYLIDSGYNDPSYVVTTDANGVSYIKFGDNVSGRIPPAGSIYVTYRVGGGASGNVGPNTLNYSLTNVISGVTVNNQEAAYGGSDAESTDSIRFNAPFALTALDRAVSLSDYAALAIKVPSVGKAVADAAVYNSIILYMAPYGDNSLGTPGVDANGDPTEVFNNAVTDIFNFITDKAPATTTLTILPPKYVPINITMDLYVSPQYKQATVTTGVLTSLNEILSGDNTIFGEKFVLQYVLAAVLGTSGAEYGDVSLLTRSEASFTGDIIAGSATVTNVSSFLNVNVGDYIAVREGNVTIGSSITVSAIDSVAETITLSAVAGGTGSTTAASLWTSSLATTGVHTIQCDTNEIPKLGVITINPIGGIPS